jgi:two-component system cell cycle sensor histidine kinase/response regulator CckA
MAPLTALLFIFTGAGLWCIVRESPELGLEARVIKRTFHLLWLGRAFAAAVFLLGTLHLSSLAFHWNLGMDHLGFMEATSVIPPARSAPATMADFVLLSVGMFLASTPRFPRLFQFIVFLGSLVAWLGLSRYVYGGDPLLPYSMMAPHTAVTFLILSGGILNCRPNFGLVALLSSDSAGGEVARRLVPSALGVPLILGWLRLIGERSGWYGTEAGTALLVLGNILVFGGLIWGSAAGLHRTDIARKEAEQILRRQASLFDQSYDAVIVWEWKGSIIFWNRAAERMYGFSRGEAVGSICRNLLQTSAQNGMESLLQSLEEHRFWEGEIQHKKKNGKRILVETRMVLFDEGERTYVLETIREIGEKRLLEAQLRQSQKMEGIGRLAGGVAHDFNNMLGVILGCAELLQESSDLQSVRSRSEEIRTAAERAANLTRQLLAFSRKQILEPKTIDLNLLLSDMSKMLVRLVGEDVEVRTLLQSDVWKVLLDPGQVEQILMNLAVNAREAMPKGGKLTFETQNVDFDDTYTQMHVSIAPGPYVMICVTDSGIGMDAETQSRVFEPFFTTKASGTGLGLATVYGAVKQSGGFIWLYSEPGKGTTFKIYFPRVECPAESAAPEKTEAHVPQGSETILLVEDFESLRDVTREFLRMAGYTVIAAGSGSEALRLGEQHHGAIQLLLTDVVMPHMSGTELAIKFKQCHPEARVLFMSGYTAGAIVHHGVLDDGVALLPKPFTRSVLTQKVRDFLKA